MVISEYRSTVVLPKMDKPYPSILEFFKIRFPRIDTAVWESRIDSGKVTTENGEPISSKMAYEPLKTLHYFREVEDEPIIPFTEKILFCDEELLVACKPHFLPVTPVGAYVNECLLHRLKKRTGNSALSSIHRIDRETAGLVLFSMNQKSRGRYQEMFMKGAVQKTYDAVTNYPCHGNTGHDKRSDTAKHENSIMKKKWIVENRMVQGDPWFRMKIVPGRPNAISKISFLKSKGDKALFQLSPLTGKKHQLRLHLSGLGFPIVNDRFYPDLLPEKTDAFEAPLQLLARKIQFQDPVTGRHVTYESERRLSLERD